MLDFWRAAFEHPMARHALWMGLLASLACGVVGAYVVTRRITYIAAGVAHCALGGLGAARWLAIRAGWDWLHPIHGAYVAALLAAAVIGWVTLRAREREDTAIGAVWAIGMAAGVLFIYHTPGYQQDLMSYLFGNILLVSGQELWLMAGLNVVILAVTILFFPQLQAVCFDEEFARARNLRVGFYSMLLLTLTALTVVTLSLVAGLALVIALLTLPAALAGRWSRSLLQMMALASLACAGIILAGLTVSYRPDWPPGPVIILVAGAAYFFFLPRGRRSAPRAAEQEASR